MKKMMSDSKNDEYINVRACTHARAYIQNIYSYTGTDTHKNRLWALSLVWYTHMHIHTRKVKYVFDDKRNSTDDNAHAQMLFHNIHFLY
jgi:hypothetical protein